MRETITGREGHEIAEGDKVILFEESEFGEVNDDGRCGVVDRVIDEFEAEVELGLRENRHTEIRPAQKLIRDS